MYILLCSIGSNTSSEHWTLLAGGNYNIGNYPPSKGIRGGYPGSRSYFLRASFGDILYMFGGFGYGSCKY